MSIKSLAIINQTAPFGHANAKDALDVALIMGSYEQPTSLYFHGDGVWQLVQESQPEKLNIKNFIKTFDALAFYDIEHIYVCQDSLLQRGLTAINEIDGLSILPAIEFSASLKRHHFILNF
ncbi:sulfurtransferase complex subunit TusC [Thalassotalea sediminis]|uniref:sulfurtransferase complex subunit TusC n=1 Tax=Thalassotalea sediminis TaxID=1759089 RepID=UPI002572CFD4|nr:sulfurtransferase complex subunit TusC [Thalassotalea sediminis]